MLPSVSGMFLCSLGDAIPEARTQNTKASPEDTITLPATTNIEGVEPQLITTQGRDNTIPAETATSSAETNPPAAAEVLPKKEVMVPVTEMDSGALRNLINPWAVSPAMAENWIIPTTRPGDKLVSPTPSDQAGRGETMYTNCDHSWLLYSINCCYCGTPPSVAQLCGKLC